MKSVRTCLLATLFAALFCVSTRAETIRVASPEGRVVLTFTIGDSATYRATYDDAVVVDNSKLGLKFRNADALGALEVVDVREEKIDNRWFNPFGIKLQYEDKCVETTIQLRERDGARRRLGLVARAYDDGFAFRYVVPKGSGFADETGEFCIESENTEFTFGADYDCWATFYRNHNTSQEEEFPQRKLSDIKPDAFVGAPLVVHGNGFYAALTESDLIDWAGALFTGSSDVQNSVSIQLAPRKDGRGAVVSKEGARSPWRVALLGKKPVDIINNSGIILNTATPCVLNDVSWIQPGNASWNWWAPKSGELTFDLFKDLIDFSADMGWAYVLVDAGWSQLSDPDSDGNVSVQYRPRMDLPRTIAYAREKGVRVLVWFHYTDLVKVGAREALKQCAEWGVAGVKIDFMDSHNQEMVQWLTEVVQIAAEYKLLVDYHGMYKPTGFERTYPNQITREGIRGNEYNRWGRQSTTHTATLPFTRCVLGPGDYTPGGFRNETTRSFKSLNDLKDPQETCRVIGTRARELALCAIISSPLRCLCDLPQNYRGQPGLEFLRDLPTVWKETRALEGTIGESLVLLRRSGDDYWLSGITNEEGRDFEVALDFLPEGVAFEGTLYADAQETRDDPNRIEITTKTYRRGDVLRVTAAPDGGWNLVLRKVK